MADATAHEERVLFLAPTRKDAVTGAGVLTAAGLTVRPCGTLGELCGAIWVGGGCVVVPEEAVFADRAGELAKALRDQPAWSNLPVLILTSAGRTPDARLRALLELGDVSLLRRPLEAGEFLNAVRTALRDRRRQYQVRDHVAERERQAAALQDREARLQLAVEIAGMGTFDIDLRTDAVEVNETGRDIYGWADTRTTFARVQTQFHPDDKDAVLRDVQAAFDPAGPGGFEVEQRIVRTDGAVRWIRVRGRSFFEGTGPDRRAVRCVGTYLDVTDRKLAEERLRASEARFRFLDEQTAATRDLADPTAVMTAATRLLGRHLGVTRCAYADVDDDGDRFTIRDDWRAVGATTTAGVYSLDLFGTRAAADMRAGRLLVVRDVDAELAPADGGDTFTAIGIKAIVCCPLVKDGRLRAMMAVHHAAPRDWTADEVALVREAAERSWAHIERVRDAAALRASEGRFRTLFESMDEGYCVIEMIFDPAGTGRAVDYRFLEVNPAFEAQSGMRSVVGRRMLEFVPSIEDHWLANYGRVALTGKPIRFADEYKTLNRWFDVYAFRVGSPDAHKVGVLFTDITARKRAEDGLREADRRKDEFLAMLAHELRNPLAPIKNGLEILRRADGDPAAGRDTRDMIARQVDHLTRLVDDLLDVSRITRGKVELRPAEVDLTTVLTRAAEGVRPLADARGHRLTVTYPPRPVWVRADLTRLVQVVGNLLTNAAKYSNRGGRIDLSLAEEGGEAVIRVADTGTGIPADVLPRVFDLFAQADRTLDRSDGGLGIGLTLVKGLVELHGGSVTAASDGPGRGSVFTVRLPVLRRAANPTPTTTVRTDSPSRAAAKRVLVVDDNADAADSLATLLQLLGHRVRVAHTGAEALQTVDSFRPEVGVLDIGLPGMNGYELAGHLRADRNGDPLLLIALTGYGQAEDRLRARAAGFDHHLTKPADPAALLELISAAGRPR